MVPFFDGHRSGRPPCGLSSESYGDKPEMLAAGSGCSRSVTKATPLLDQARALRVELAAEKDRRQSAIRHLRGQLVGVGRLAGRRQMDRDALRADMKQDRRGDTPPEFDLAVRRMTEGVQVLAAAVDQDQHATRWAKEQEVSRRLQQTHAARRRRQLGGFASRVRTKVRRGRCRDPRGGPSHQPREPAGRDPRDPV